ncbi:CPBP family intramembrane glutamic endopeptidase [Fictibacillus gelatini]|uniref:CPBP family intramembrane glutamic endopeptidase n=1 Tax=Fictibacillus gelatini TaxID=225985 RepID=UPI000418FA21|nr:type II CAAX endopeptidase family protein [Fictibacillus gelatini]
MRNRYWWIAFTYIIMQFSGIVGVPVLQYFHVPRHQIAGLWLTISFTIALVIICILLVPDMKTRHEQQGRVSRMAAIGWAIFGIFLAYVSQIIAGSIELKVLGINPQSENTNQLVAIAGYTPYFIVVTSIIGPILEEIIFRKIIFGSLYNRFNFLIAGLISSLVFAAVHGDFKHLLVYTMMGFVFAFLYVKTKRILVPIVAHASMNTLVFILVLNKDAIQNYLEKMQIIIGGIMQ